MYLIRTRLWKFHRFDQTQLWRLSRKSRLQQRTHQNRVYIMFVIGLSSIQKLPINISFRSVMLGLLLSVKKKCFRPNYLNQYFSNSHAYRQPIVTTNSIKSSKFLTITKITPYYEQLGNFNTKKCIIRVTYERVRLMFPQIHIGSVSSSSFSSEQSGRESFGFFYSCSLPFSITFSWWWLI